MQKSTIAEWLYRKGLLTDNEFLAEKCLAVLWEWHLASRSPADSTEIFGRKYNETARPLQMAPYQVHLDKLELAPPGSVEPEKTAQPDVEQLAEPAWTRDHRNRLVYAELGWLARLLEGAFPAQACPMVPCVLLQMCWVATVRIEVQELPHKEIPFIVSAMYVVKEAWRERLLETAIDDAINRQINAITRRKPTRTASEGDEARDLAA